MPLASFFVALGIPQVGRKMGKLLAKYVSEKIGNREQKIENREEGIGDRSVIKRENSIIRHPELVSGSSAYGESEERKKEEDSGSESGMTSILCDILFHLTYEELEQIHDVGSATAGSIVYYFEENRDMITRLLREVHPTFTSIQK